MPCNSTMLVTRRPPCQNGPPALRGKAVTTHDALQCKRGRHRLTTARRCDALALESAIRTQPEQDTSVSYRELVQAVIDENRRVLEAVPEADVQRLIGEIERAKTIQLYAMGRMQASMRGFAMRLKHMGLGRSSRWPRCWSRRFSSSRISSSCS